MKKYRLKNKFRLCSYLSLAIMASFVSAYYTSKNDTLKVSKLGYETLISVSKSDADKVLSDDEIFQIILKENHNTIIFLTNTFKIKEDNFLKYLDVNKEELLESNNIEKYLLDELFNLEKENKLLFNSRIEKCKDNKEYILALIKYFIKFYPEVDFSIAAGIADVESNYSSSATIYSNNIFGGLSNGRIIRYKNIEYGVLRYVKLLNNGYFSKGLNTIESIGKKYNPTYIDGKKVAKPNWVTNVTIAASKYGEYRDVDVNLLIDLKNND